MQKLKTLRHRIRASRSEDAFRFGGKELIGQTPELPDLLGCGSGNSNKLRSSVASRIHVSQQLIWAEVFQSGDVPSAITRAAEHRNKQTSFRVKGIPSCNPFVK